MRYQVIVSFGKGKDYEYGFSADDMAGITPEEARRWFDREYADLQCEVNNPVGKVLIIDKILGVARAGSEQRFLDGKDWASRFALYAAAALTRDTVRIDVAAFNIEY